MFVELTTEKEAEEEDEEEEEAKEWLERRLVCKEDELRLRAAIVMESGMWRMGNGAEI